MHEAQPLHIFRAGRHVAQDGQVVEFTAADLAASAAAYDPNLHEAPLTVGHPASNGPAYGWVQRLAAVDADLDAVPHQVDPAFAELVAAGRYKKISASFYRPDAPANPVPGVWYVRHVGFLGAQPPAVKGLRAPSFADGEEGIVEFADWGDRENAGLWRRMREWLLSQFGQETADQVIPSYAVDTLQEEAVRPTPDNAPAPGFAEPPVTPAPTQEPTMTDAEIAAQQAALDARQQELDAKEAAFAERETQLSAAEIARRRDETAAYVDGLIAAGRVLPRDRDGLVAFMAGLETDAVVEFAEDGKTVSKPQPEWLRGFLDALQPQVDYSERAGADGKPAVDTADPVAISKAAAEFQETERKAGRTVGAAQAVAHVMTQGVKP